VGSRAAELAPPSTALDVTDDIAVTTHALVLIRRITCRNRKVYPASDEFPAGTAVAGMVIVASALLRRYLEVPCYDETISGTSLDNGFWRRATEKLGGGTECKRGDTEAVGYGVGLRMLKRV
jgi:hypothetical protein